MRCAALRTHPPTSRKMTARATRRPLTRQRSWLTPRSARARTLVAQMASSLTGGSRVNKPVGVVAQPVAPPPVIPSGTVPVASQPSVTLPANPTVPVVDQPDAPPPVAVAPQADPWRPNAGGAYLTRSEAGQAPQMRGVRPSMQTNPADASRADAINDYLSAVSAARLRPESQDFNSGDRATDLEDRRAALEGYQPQKRKWWDNVKAALPPALFAAARTGNPLAAAGALLGGVTVGTADRRYADQAWRQNELQRTGAQLEQESELEDAAAKRQVLANQAMKDYAEARNAMLKPAQDAANRQQAADNEEANRVLSLYNGLKSFDPAGNDPQTVGIMAVARKHNLYLPKKTEKDHFTLHQGKDGTAIILNDDTGEIKTGGNFDTLSESDFPDSLFGLPDEKQIADQARAAVGQITKQRVMRQDVLDHYIQGVRDKLAKDNQTASEDEIRRMAESNLWDDLTSGGGEYGSKLRLSDVYDDVTPNDEQQLAQVRSNLRQKNTAERARVEDFKFRVVNNAPLPGVQHVVTPVTMAVNRFNEIRAMKPGREQDDALRNFYSAMPYMNIVKHGAGVTSEGTNLRPLSVSEFPEFTDIIAAARQNKSGQLTTIPELEQGYLMYKDAYDKMKDSDPKKALLKQNIRQVFGKYRLN